jgi:hypothetical protein
VTTAARSALAFSGSTLLMLMLAACEGNSPIPAGAQQVQISVSPTGVQLQPATVHAGDVYLVLDSGQISFVEQKATADATPGPLTDEDIAQIGRGNTQGTSITGFEAGNCDPQQNASARGQLGPCGNVMLVKLQAGNYLVAGAAPEELGTPSSVLHVVP